MRSNTDIENTMKAHGDAVWRACLLRMGSRADAQDMLQETFLAYATHDPVVFNDEEHRKAWLIRCAVNRAKSLHASPWRRRTVPLETAAQIGVEDEYREVYSAVLALPAKYRAVIHLFYFEGLTTAEIAGHLGIAEGTVRSQLSRGRALLREALKEEIEL